MATSASDCTTTYSSKVHANLVELGSPMLDYTVDLSEWSEGSTVDVYDEISGNMCFQYPDGKPPSLRPSPRPTSNAPSPRPSPRPTSNAVTPSVAEPEEPKTVEVALTLGMSGLTCAEYSTAEQAVVNLALAEHIEGTNAESFSEHVCTEDSAGGVTRRALLASTISISTSVTVATDTYGTDSASDIATSIASVIDTAISSGGLTASVVSHAETAGLTTLASASVASFSAEEITSASATSDDDGDIVVIVIVIIIVLFIVAGVAAVVYFYRSGDTHLQHNKAKDPKAGENVADSEVTAPEALVVQPSNFALFLPGFSDGDGGGALELGAADKDRSTNPSMSVLCCDGDGGGALELGAADKDRSTNPSMSVLCCAEPE